MFFVRTKKVATEALDGNDAPGARTMNAFCRKHELDGANVVCVCYVFELPTVRIPYHRFIKDRVGAFSNEFT